MFFYKIEAAVNSKKMRVSSDEGKAFVTSFRTAANTEWHKSKNTRLFFICNIKNGKVTVGTAETVPNDVGTAFREFVAAADILLSFVSVEEITFDEFSEMLSSADINCCIDENDELANLGLDMFRYNFFRFGERLIEEPESKESLKEYAEKILVCDSLNPEIERIYKGREKETDGHPVHYLISCGDRDTRRETYKTLLSALYANGRLKSRRYCFCDFSAEDNVRETQLEDFYRLCEYGTVVIRINNNSFGKGEGFAVYGSGLAETVCAAARRHRREVLTVLCLPAGNFALKTEFLQNLNGISVVELKENSSDRETSFAYLKNLASAHGFDADDGLFSLADNTCDAFSPADLKRIFDRWYDDKVRTEIYPQYTDECLVRAELAKSVAKGNAINELHEMIGLKNAKEVIETAVNYYKMRKLFRDEQGYAESPSMHMVFTGNPGTAKTSVARLFAGIMRDNGLLSVGKLFELGRSDIVGKYVGWTADIVKKKFREARGSVLFIDEAYSLVDSSGSFGDEAINTIVQEMENAREDTVVIFAGYPKEMEEFLKKNPGLRSRIAFHVPFDDYGTQELVSIAELIAKKRGSLFSDEAKEKLASVFDAARRSPDFGNGRYARNIVERAEMRRANRLAKLRLEEITRRDMQILTADDVCATQNGAEQFNAAPRRIGFCTWSADERNIYDISLKTKQESA